MNDLLKTKNIKKQIAKIGDDYGYTPEPEFLMDLSKCETLQTLVDFCETWSIKLEEVNI
jgi:hypothetical protein